MTRGPGSANASVCGTNFNLGCWLHPVASRRCECAERTHRRHERSHSVAPRRKTSHSVARRKRSDPRGTRGLCRGRTGAHYRRRGRDHLVVWSGCEMRGTNPTRPMRSYPVVGIRSTAPMCGTDSKLGCLSPGGPVRTIQRVKRTHRAQRESYGTFAGRSVSIGRRRGRAERTHRVERLWEEAGLRPRRYAEDGCDSRVAARTQSRLRLGDDSAINVRNEPTAKGSTLVTIHSAAGDDVRGEESERVSIEGKWTRKPGSLLFRLTTGG